MGSVIFSGSIIWHSKASSQNVPPRVDKHDSRFDQSETKIAHPESLALETAYTLMKVISGEKDKMNKWMVDIEKCVKSGGKDCEAVKSIAEVYQKEIQKEN